MTNVNDEYYGSAEQCFWEGPCKDLACGYCAKRKAPKRRKPAVQAGPKVRIQASDDVVTVTVRHARRTRDFA